MESTSEKSSVFETTITESVTPTVTKSVTPTVTESVKEEYESKEYEFKEYEGFTDDISAKPNENSKNMPYVEESGVFEDPYPLR